MSTTFVGTTPSASLCCERPSSNLSLGGNYPLLLGGRPYTLRQGSGGLLRRPPPGLQMEVGEAG
jgi:hypothetical protein